MIATATTFGSIASYMCRGHDLVNGSTNRTCQADAHWSGTTPTCIGELRELIRQKDETILIQHEEISNVRKKKDETILRKFIY